MEEKLLFLAIIIVIILVAVGIAFTISECRLMQEVEELKKITIPIFKESIFKERIKL